MDKPGARADMYHTNYSLTGLAAAMERPDGSEIILGGDEELRLRNVDPVLNIPKSVGLAMREFLLDKC